MATKEDDWIAQQQFTAGTFVRYVIELLKSNVKAGTPLASLSKQVLSFG